MWRTAKLAQELTCQSGRPGFESDWVISYVTMVTLLDLQVFYFGQLLLTFRTVLDSLS